MREQRARPFPTVLLFLSSFRPRSPPPPPPPPLLLLLRISSSTFAALVLGCLRDCCRVIFIRPSLTPPSFYHLRDLCILSASFSSLWRLLSLLSAVLNMPIGSDGNPLGVLTLLIRSFKRYRKINDAGELYRRVSRTYSLPWSDSFQVRTYL